jgi:hypothetical protein
MCADGHSVTGEGYSKSHKVDHHNLKSSSKTVKVSKLYSYIITLAGLVARMDFRKREIQNFGVNTRRKN